MWLDQYMNRNQGNTTPDEILTAAVQQVIDQGVEHEDDVRYEAANLLGFIGIEDSERLAVIAADLSAKESARVAAIRRASGW